MSSRLAQYLAELAAHPHKAAELKADPEHVMEGIGLSIEEKDVLRRADPTELRAVLSQHDPQGNSIGVLVVTIFAKEQ